jgi:glutaredoxin
MGVERWIFMAAEGESSRPILFSLEQCIKCQQTKEMLSDRSDIEILTLPHEFANWSEDDIALAKKHNVFEDLQRTAPILWLDGDKIVGYLRIRKWIQDSR